MIGNFCDVRDLMMFAHFMQPVVIMIFWQPFAKTHRIKMMFGFVSRANWKVKCSFSGAMTKGDKVKRQIT